MLVELLDLKNHQDSEIHRQRTSGQDRNRNRTLMFFHWVSLPAETNPANQAASSVFRLKQRQDNGETPYMEKEQP